MDEHPDAVIRVSYTGGEEVWKLQDFEDVAERVKNLHNQLGEFAVQLQGAILMMTGQSPVPDQKPDEQQNDKDPSGSTSNSGEESENQ